MSSEALIINLAPTGMVPTKEITPHVPISTEEILEDVERCRAHGAAIIHVHARDEGGRPSHLVYAGDRLFRRHVLADREWNITRDARRFMHEHPQLIAEEQDWISRPPALEADSVEVRALHQFRALQLDFGVIDFALPPDGDLVIFEINACVQITNHEAERESGTRRYFESNNARILDALLELIRARAAAG